MNLEKTKNNHDKGYTLVELMAVLIIIGILATLVIASLGKYKQRAAEEYVNSLEGQMELAAKSYYSDNPTELPRGQIVNGEKIYNTKIMASTLADAGYFTNELVDQNGNSCESESYAIARNINNTISYDTCLICNGKVLNESAYCKLSGFEVTNTLPYCSIKVENMQQNIKKLTVYSNTTNSVISHDITVGSDGNYYVYKPGTYRFTVTNNEGLTANCQTTVYMEEDKIKPSCSVTETSSNNRTITYKFTWSDNISVSSVVDTGRGIDQSFVCSYEKFTTGTKDDASYTFTKGATSKSYYLKVTDCNGNEVTCDYVIPKRTSSVIIGGGDSDTCVGSDCEDTGTKEPEDNPIVNENGKCNNGCGYAGNKGPIGTDCKRYVCDSDCNAYWEIVPNCNEEENPNTGCFLSGTKILTQNGLKNIEDIKVGDYVLSYNEETKQTEYNRVYDTFIHTKNNEELYELTINGKILKVTAAHRFYVKEKGTTEFIWKEAKELKVGDILLDSNNKEQKITNINHYIHFGTVYNFAVENNHNYYVTENGYLVHNCKCGEPGCVVDGGGNRCP